MHTVSYAKFGMFFCQLVYSALCENRDVNQMQWHYSV